MWGRSLELLSGLQDKTCLSTTLSRIDLPTPGGPSGLSKLNPVERMVHGKSSSAAAVTVSDVAAV